MQLLCDKALRVYKSEVILSLSKPINYPVTKHIFECDRRVRYLTGITCFKGAGYISKHQSITYIVGSEAQKVHETFILLPDDTLHTDCKQNASLHIMLGLTLLLLFASGLKWSHILNSICHLRKNYHYGG